MPLLAVPFGLHLVGEIVPPDLEVFVLDVAHFDLRLNLDVGCFFVEARLLLVEMVLLWTLLVLEVCKLVELGRLIDVGARLFGRVQVAYTSKVCQ